MGLGDGPHIFRFKFESEDHLLQKLKKLMRAEIIEMTTDTFEIIARAPEGYVWADNGQDEISDAQWAGETKKDVKRNIAERMQKGLQKFDN